MGFLGFLIAMILLWIWWWPSEAGEWAAKAHRAYLRERNGLNDKVRRR
ncbi:hypothetical protein [Mesorhizobium sp.]|nr:hypothetical protein [Mesorhizobium sp.]